jgi:hypothetical protein
MQFSWKNFQALAHPYDPLPTQKKTSKSMEAKKASSSTWFRSRDLRVMSPARFRCAMLLTAEEAAGLAPLRPE